MSQKLLSPESPLEASTSNFFLASFLHDFPVEPLCRVLSADELDHFSGRQEDFHFIVNLSTRWEPGTHFVVISRQQNDIFFLDSLNLGFVLHDHIPKFLNSMLASETRIHGVKHAYQHADSWLCGFFCINFIYMLDPGDEAFTF